MPVQKYHADATEQDEHTAQSDQPARESPVPPVLRRLFERPESERSAPPPLAVFQLVDWPACPDCADRLIPATVATDAQETLVAAAMRCYNSAHETKRYVYNVATDTVYVDQVLADPASGPLDG